MYFPCRMNIAIVFLFSVTGNTVESDFCSIMSSWKVEIKDGITREGDYKPPCEPIMQDLCGQSNHNHYSSILEALCRDVIHNLTNINAKPVEFLYFSWNITFAWFDELDLIAPNSCSCNISTSQSNWKLIDICNINTDTSVDLLTSSCECSIYLKEQYCPDAIPSINPLACSSEPCQNGGTCSLDVDIKCICSNGFTGDYCEKHANLSSNLQACISDPCQNGGTCSDHNNTVTCICPRGFTGTFCDHEIIVTTNEISHRKTTDQPFTTSWLDTSASLTLTSTLKSVKTSQDTNEMTIATTSAPVNTTHDQGTESLQCGDTIPSIPCHIRCDNGHNGSIGCKINSNSTLNCTCKPGYIGRTCSCDVDECASNPCGEGRSCIDKENAYFCVPRPSEFPFRTVSQSSSTSAAPSVVIPSSSASGDGVFNNSTETSTGSSSGLKLRDILIIIGVILFVSCIPLALVLLRYYKAKNKLRASRRAYRTEHELVERMSSAHFTNPAYITDKGDPVKLHVGRTVPPPLSPRPIISLPTGSGPENDIYAEYVYIDGPRANLPSFGNGPSAGKGVSGSPDNGEYIYVVDAFGSPGNEIGGSGPSVPKTVGPLPSAPPPSAGEYIYFDESLTASITADPCQYVQEPSYLDESLKRSETTSVGFSKKPVPPIASVRPLPLEPPSSDLHSLDKGNENVYEELPEGNIAKPKWIDDPDIELDNDLYLKPQNSVM